MNNKKPFDDGNEFLKKHLGAPDKVEIKKLPKPLKVIGYFIIGGIFIFGLLMIIAYIGAFI